MNNTNEMQEIFRNTDVLHESFTDSITKAGVNHLHLFNLIRDRQRPPKNRNGIDRIQDISKPSERNLSMD